VSKIRDLAVRQVFVCCAFLLSSPAWGDTSATEKPVHVVVVAVASDQLSLDVTTAASTVCDINMACRMHLSVTDNTVKDQLKQLHKGDHIQIVYSTETKTPVDTKTPADAKNVTDTQNKLVLKAWCVDSMPLSPWSRVRALLASAGACLLLTLIFSGGKPTQLIISEDNRYSNSRFQMALWFFVLITTYVAALLLRVVWAGPNFLGGVNIPQNILLLSGMSAFTFAGAKAITAGKTGTPGTAAQKPAAGAPNFFLDLTHNDGIPATPARPAVPAHAAVGDQPAVAFVPPVSAQNAKPPQFDYGDFQMLIITLIAVATYLVLVFNFFGTVEYSQIVSLPDVDTTLLATFGLGQGAYLTKKAVGNLGSS
jgi:hypothetical protein